jgi:hypothetical protein
MAKITLNDITTEFRGQAQINNNFTAIENEFQNKVLYRNNPGNEANSMQNNLDMNGFNLLNVGNPTALGISNATAVNIPYENSATGAVVVTVQSKLSEFLSVKDFGAVGNGTTDDTAAIQAAFDAAEDRVLLFPKGTYLCGAVTISKQVRAVGEGADATYIKASGAAINLWSVTTTTRVDVQNMTFSPFNDSVTQTGGAYLKYDPTSGYNFGSRIQNCIFVRPYRGVQFVDAAGWSIEDCYFVVYEYGVEVQNIATPDAGDSTIRASIFDAGGTTGTAILQKSSGGLRIINNKLLNGAYGYIGSFDTNPSMTSILLVQSNSIENQDVAAITFNSSNNTTFGQVLIEGNQFSVKNSAEGIRIEDPGYDFLDSINLSDNLFNLGSNSTGLYLDRGSRIVILPNTFYGNGTNETGIFVGGNVDSVVFYPQVLLDGTTGLAGTVTNITFYQGLSLGGTQSATASVTFGPLFATIPLNVSFPIAFPVAPKVQATANNKGGGGSVSTNIYDISAGGFTMIIFGVTTGNVVAANWFATL